MSLILNIRSQVISILNSPISHSSLSKLKFLQIIHSSLLKDTFISKRSIFYSSVPLFKSQNIVNSLIEKYSKIFQCNQDSLKVKSGLKGLLSGNIKFILNNNDTVFINGKSLIPDISTVKEIQHDYKTILVIEKDTIFDKILSNNMNYMVVCGKGYPCKNTINLLKRLSSTISNIFCLTDFDPYGIHIFLIYKRNIPKIQRIGLCIENLFKNKLNYDECIKLTERDLKMIERIRKGEGDEGVLKELEFMEGLGMKMELEIVFNSEKYEWDLERWLQQTEGRNI